MPEDVLQSLQRIGLFLKGCLCSVEKICIFLFGKRVFVCMAGLGDKGLVVDAKKAANPVGD